MQFNALSHTLNCGLNLTEVLWPQKLQETGYDTALIGKWHLGFAKWDYTPLYRGFNTFKGFFGAAIDYFNYNFEIGLVQYILDLLTWLKGCKY